MGDSIDDEKAIYLGLLNYVEGETVVHVVSSNPVDADHPNELYYYYTGGDSHPTNEGHQKATEEFFPLLNAYYNLWQHYR